MCYDFFVAILIDNRKIHFNYEILEKFEAGIELLGHEVKSLKKGQGSIEGAYAVVRGGEAYVTNVFIPPYQENNTPKEYDPRRNRKLLLEKSEIERLANMEGSDGLTVVPISIYNKGNLIKISIAVVRGKKKFDKRESIKKRETDRNIRREFRDR